MKILMIGAHQDDNEFNCGGLAVKFVKAGHEVRFLSMCNGCGGHHIMTPEETTARRAKESRAVAEYLGVTYDVWDIDDCSLVADLPTRRRLIVYIRNFAPDLIITHRTCDYHADHRAVGQLVQDASYLLIVPHECPQAPALKKTPVIMYAEDEYVYTHPVFRPDYVFDIGEEVETKIGALALNDSQVYEWLPYTEGIEDQVPEGEAERFAWLRGEEITEDMTDEEILALKRGYLGRFAKSAARFRQQLIARYGEERGKKVRFAEGYEVCEYGGAVTPELEKELRSF